MGAVYLYDIVNRSYGYVKDYYKPGISYVKLDNSAENAWELMMKNRTKWCAVVDNGKFMGIITLESIQFHVIHISIILFIFWLEV